MYLTNEQIWTIARRAAAAASAAVLAIFVLMAIAVLLGGPR